MSNEKPLDNIEEQYLDAMRLILEEGHLKENRTGIDTKDIFGVTLRHDYVLGFPLLTTKKMYTKAILHELIWFLKGTEDAQYLIDNKIRIWDEWMKEKSELVPAAEKLIDGISVTDTERKVKKILPHTYGVKWRDFDGVDQIANLIEQIKTNPNSRRHIVSAWDPRHVNDTALPWCHILQQYNVRDGHLDISVYQRSADWFLGVPFNIASYSFLVYMIAELTGLKPGRMIYTFGSSHLYENHFSQCEEQLSNPMLTLPTLKVNHRNSIDDFVYDDFVIENYVSAKTIKAKVAV